MPNAPTMYVYIHTKEGTLLQFVEITTDGLEHSRVPTRILKGMDKQINCRRFDKTIRHKLDFRQITNTQVPTQAS